jgi:NAD(P)-dependent dehydrogenase (short-subunit alcohol dehydrogenase family)
VAPKWTTAQIPDLSGRVAVVTGANSGIGWEAALELARHGAHTVLACRDAGRAQAAVDRIRSAHAGASVEVLPLDLSSLASARAFAQQFSARFPRLDLLVNNAGVMTLPYSRTIDGFERQLGTNHLGHFALTGLLLDRLCAAPAARVVVLSSLVHHGGRIRFDDLQSERRYGKWAAYAQSKLANMLFMRELQRRLAAARRPVISVACHPGYASTNLQLVGPRMAKSSLGSTIMGLGNRLLAQSASLGALPTLYAATAAQVIGGEYYGPRGLFGLWGHPARARISAAGRDEKLARELWERSVALTGVRFESLASAA